MRHQHDRDGIHGIHQARPEDRDHGDCKQQARQRQHDVHQTHDRDFHHAAKKSGDQTQHDANAQRQRHRDHADEQR